VSDHPAASTAATLPLIQGESRRSRQGIAHKASPAYSDIRKATSLQSPKPSTPSALI
jgi:hypothetical protein